MYNSQCNKTFADLWLSVSDQTERAFSATYWTLDFESDKMSNQFAEI